MLFQLSDHPLICSKQSHCLEYDGVGVTQAMPVGLIAKIVDDIALSVVITDQHGRVCYANHHAKNNVNAAQSLKLNHYDPLLDEQQIGEHNKTTILSALKKQKQWQFDYKTQQHGYATTWEQVSMSAICDEQDNLCYIVIYRHDITAERNSLEQLSYNNSHDRLTGLVNKEYVLTQLETQLTTQTATASHIAVLVLDIDNFHAINDAHGYNIGDQLLKDIAARLTTGLPHAHLIGRLSGDKFIVLFKGITERYIVDDYIESIQQLFSHEFDFTDKSILTSVCIGVSLSAGASDAIQLLRDADSAVHHAKASGKNSYVVFNEQLKHGVLRSSQIEVAMRSAISNNELAVYFQPIVDSHSGQIVCAEALLRWHNPALGWISPAEFIPIAEQSGQIVKLGNWVLEQVCQQVAQWRQLALPLYACVNVSAVQLIEHYQFYATFMALLERYDLTSADLELEVTESLMLDNDERHAETLQQLIAAQCRFAIDDFGTGFSSLKTLSQFEFHKLKIDKSFIQNVLTSKRDRSVTQAIAQIAKTLDMQITAEGVETDEMLQFCKSLECDFIQGFLFYKPMTAKALFALLQQQASMLETNEAR
ncbi:EAL domain-containing protein [Rheinheimera sp. UJ51]|uniref:putative bifunctional diguanylate cyclase/phosphodiesterase n=1 Tax=Rheinheimera sp. UJ51 TaxID=2892446 RepID=UPI001E29E67F|nr:EAL domain-containing protein [Rheinheimera sp. UJ51]MCC5451837.1 EAL domain-containing protein [Rheinheimera sp. UJ51]